MFVKVELSQSCYTGLKWILTGIHNEPTSEYSLLKAAKIKPKTEHRISSGRPLSRAQLVILVAVPLQAALQHTSTAAPPLLPAFWLFKPTHRKGRDVCSPCFKLST